jgi:hypothetical protein
MTLTESRRRASSVLLVLSLMSTSCTSQKTIASLGVEYEKANKAAADAVALESGQVKRVRRLGAVIAYINNPSLTIVENLNASQVPGSFINFVCTGADDFEITSAGLRFTGDYAKSIKAITTVPEDSISGYIGALAELKGKNKVLALPDIQKNQFEQCRQQVANDVPPRGVTAVTARQENPAAAIAAIQAGQALIESLQKLIKAGLKLATQAAQRAVLVKFIAENRENYKRVLQEDLNSTELSRAFDRRRQVTVAVPFYAFEAMMKLSPTTERAEIVKRAIVIDEDLREYDAIRTQRQPGAIVDHFASINRKLEDYAEGRISLGELTAFLSETAQELADAKKGYDDVAKKFGDLTGAFGSK